MDPPTFPQPGTSGSARPLPHLNLQSARHPTPTPALLLLTQDAATQMPKWKSSTEPPRVNRVSSTPCPSCWDGMWLLEKQLDLPAVLKPCRRHVDPCVSRGNSGDCHSLPLHLESTVPLPSALGPCGPAGAVCPHPRTLCLCLGLGPCQRGCL